MSRCIFLVFMLLSFLTFFILLPLDGTHSQTRRSGSPAVNALAAGAANYESSRFCFEKTIEELDKAIAREPSNSRLYTDRAFCRNVFAANLSVDDYRRSISKIKSEASVDVERAIAKDPKNAQAYFLRAKAAAESLEFAEDETARPVVAQIVKDLDKALELQPGFVDIYYYRAIFKFYNHKDREGSIKDLTAAIELSPRNVNFLIKRAELFREMEQWSNAVKDFSAALGLEPENDYARLYRAKTYRQSGENAKALVDLNQTLKRAPYFEREVLEERSQVYRAMGNVRAAAADEQRLKRIR